MTYAPEVQAIARECHESNERRLDLHAEILGVHRWQRTWDELDDLQRHVLLRRAQWAWDRVQNAPPRRQAGSRMSPTFAAWLATQVERHDAIGDLARDLNAEPAWDPDHEDLDHHLCQHEACKDAWDALAQARTEYLAAALPNTRRAGVDLLLDRLRERQVRAIVNDHGTIDIAVIVDGGYIPDLEYIDDQVAYWAELIADLTREGQTRE